jgi:outer membrane lipoprotein-sorting protein
MKRLFRNMAVISLVILTGTIMNVKAQNLTGREIMDKVYNRPSPDDQISDLTMTLINKSGQTRVRKLKQFIKDDGNVEKKIMFFIAPADVKNTSFMNWSYDNSDKSDDQWIYLPAIKRVKRISSDDKSDYFMGSDFTYDDLGDRKLDDDTHKLLREETIEGKDCYVVESVPKDEDYMYSKTVTWVMKDNYLGLKKEFYDEDGELLKILHVDKYQDFSGIWIIEKIVMKNVQNNHETKMELTDIKINTGIPDSKFTQRMMMRGL